MFAAIGQRTRGERRTVGDFPSAALKRATPTCARAVAKPAVGEGVLRPPAFYSLMALAGGTYYEITNVIIECAGLIFGAAFPCIQRLKFCDLSDKFRTTTAMVPSGLVKAVVKRSSVEDELMMRLAPGRMNFEKWPI